MTKIHYPDGAEEWSGPYKTKADAIAITGYIASAERKRRAERAEFAHDPFFGCLRVCSRTKGVRRQSYWRARTSADAAIPADILYSLFVSGRPCRYDDARADR